MRAAKHPVIVRDMRIRAALLVALVVALTVVGFLTHRAGIIGDRSWVIAGDPLPEGVGPPNFRDSIDGFGLHIMKIGHPSMLDQQLRLMKRAPAAPGPSPLRFGYSILETDILGMPFVPRSEYGHVIYYETPEEFVIAPATDDYLKQIRIPSKPLSAWNFAWWRHLWGWLFVIALLGIAWFELGALRRKREALGLI